MKSLNLKFILVLTLSFFVFVFLNKQKLFESFDSEMVSRYLRSQDILDETSRIKDRIFVSDEEIYIASGYLYANGARPTEYNFQHPPFIKYLFGLSSKYFNMPLIPNIIFAGILIFEVFLLGKLVFKNELIGLVASLLLMFDPVFREVTVYALLDLGQIVFILGFIITTFFWKKNWVGQGVLLGLALASKFYSPVVIFYCLIVLYKLAIKQLTINHEVKVLAFAFLAFSICYFKSFPFNIIFYQAKIVKFMLDHNQAVEWGGVLKMFFGGYFLWPILFFVNLYQLFRSKFASVQFLLFLIPISYFLILMFQLPFTRYFILILPFLYLSFGNFLIKKII